MSLPRPTRCALCGYHWYPAFHKTPYDLCPECLGTGRRQEAEIRAPFEPMYWKKCPDCGLTYSPYYHYRYAPPGKCPNCHYMAFDKLWKKKEELLKGKDVEALLNKVTTRFKENEDEIDRLRLGQGKWQKENTALHDELRTVKEERDSYLATVNRLTVDLQQMREMVDAMQRPRPFTVGRVTGTKVGMKDSLTYALQVERIDNDYANNLVHILVRIP